MGTKNIYFQYNWKHNFQEFLSNIPIKIFEPILKTWELPQDYTLNN